MAGATLTEVGPSDDVRTAAANLTAGDTLVLQGGAYRLETIRISAKGTQDNWVVIMAKPGETPVITGISGSHNLISVRSAEYVIIDGLTVDTTADGSDALKMESGQLSHHVVIQNCEFRNFRGVGINSKGNDHHVTVHRCHIHHSIGGHGEGFYIGDHNGAVSPHHWVIENNWVHNTVGSQGDGIELKWGCYAMTVRHNVVYETQFPGILYYGRTEECPDSLLTVIEGNVVWGTGEPIGAYADVIVRNNIVFDSDQGVRSAYYSGHQNPRKVYIHNNTFYNCGSIQLRNWSSDSSCVFVNNALYSITSGINLMGSGDLYGNVGDVSHASVSPGDAGTDFVDAAGHNFYPASGSALLGACSGQWIAAQDFEGVTRDANPDAGAYERTDGARPTWTITAGFKDIQSAPVVLEGPACARGRVTVRALPSSVLLLRRGSAPIAAMVDLSGRAILPRMRPTTANQLVIRKPGLH
jgi:hypothetical protein